MQSHISTSGTTERKLSNLGLQEFEQQHAPFIPVRNTVGLSTVANDPGKIYLYSQESTTNYLIKYS